MHTTQTLDHCPSHRGRVPDWLAKRFDSWLGSHADQIYCDDAAPPSTFQHHVADVIAQSDGVRPLWFHMRSLHFRLIADPHDREAMLIDMVWVGQVDLSSHPLLSALDWLAVRFRCRVRSRIVYQPVFDQTILTVCLEDV